MTGPRAPTSPWKGEVAREAGGRGSYFALTHARDDEARAAASARTD